MPCQMVDSFGRKVTGLRIALTPRCNLKCIYCHHEGEVGPVGEIPDEMVVNVARAAAELGVRSLKFTGGEPLLRHGLPDLIAQMPQDLDISLTTNGVFLAEQAEALARAGLDRVKHQPGFTGLKKLLRHHRRKGSGPGKGSGRNRRCQKRRASCPSS